MTATLRPARHFIAVDRPRFRLHLWKRPPLRSSYSLIHSYKIAVGTVGHETPAGLWEVTDRILNPDWVMPKADWVPKADWGRRIPGGSPDNPLKGAFIALGDTEGVGIHGTADIDSLGSRASHGCIRMRPESAVALCRTVRKGTPVYII